MELKILPASCESLVDISEIENQCFGAESYSGQLLSNDFNNNLCKMFVCRSGDEVVGYINIMLIDGEAELLRIAVKPKYQGQGVGTEILNTAYQYLADDIDRMFLEVSDNNAKAKKMYSSFGFKQISRRKKYYADGSDAIIMEYCN